MTLPTDLLRLDAVFPQGADLGTVRWLAGSERERPPQDPLSPLLLPIADGGERDLFALYRPPEQGARSQVVCAVDRKSGTYAPVSASLRRAAELSMNPPGMSAGLAELSLLYQRYRSLRRAGGRTPAGGFPGYLRHVLGAPSLWALTRYVGQELGRRWTGGGMTGGGMTAPPASATP